MHCFNFNKQKAKGPLGEDDEREDNFMFALKTLPKEMHSIKLVKISKDKEVLTSLRGPNEEEGFFQHGIHVAARTISSYPHITGNPIRDGDPICDHFAVDIFADRILAAVADGCGWGIKPKLAAWNGTKAFLQHVKSNQHSPKTLKDYGILLLDGLAVAHNAIVTQKENLWEVGTTTLLGGTLLTIDPNDPKAAMYGPFVFLAASIGDSKIFHYSVTKKTFTDITVGNRPNILDPSDCGGRIGPQLDGGRPDLRNLKLVYTTCHEGDIIMLVSDGVHDNFDPQYLGKSPEEAGLDSVDSWTKLSEEELEAAKNNFRNSMIIKVMEESNFDPARTVANLLEHCLHITEPSREFLQTNIGKRLPTDYSLYPGKMDHTTCVCFTVSKSWAI